MRLSKKKEREISLIGTTALMEVLQENPFKHMDENWFDNPPDTWSDTQTEIWDALTNLETKITSRIKDLLDGK